MSRSAFLLDFLDERDFQADLGTVIDAIAMALATWTMRAHYVAGMSFEKEELKRELQLLVEAAIEVRGERLWKIAAKGKPR